MINLTNELLDAIKAKDETQAIFYLECISDSDINAISDETGNGLLHLAIQNNMPKFFDEVRKRKVDLSKINRDGKTAFVLAFEFGKEDYVNKLLEVPDPKQERKVTDERKVTEERKVRVDEGAPKLDLMFAAQKDATKRLFALNPLAAVNKILAGMGETHIAECECQPQLARSNGLRSLRDEIDYMAAIHANREYPVSKYGQPIVLLVLGSGKLKQTATMAASLMKAGRDVELILVDHEIELDRFAHKEFDEVLIQLQKEYDRKASVIGRLTSFEVYKSIMSGSGAP